MDSLKLKGLIASNGLSQRRLARMLGMTEKTFYLKMNTGVFDSDEIAQMITILSITDPIAIFLLT